MQGSHVSALGALAIMRYTNPRFTYLLTFPGILILQAVQGTDSVFIEANRSLFLGYL